MRLSDVKSDDLRALKNAINANEVHVLLAVSALIVYY